MLPVEDPGCLHWSFVLSLRSLHNTIFKKAFEIYKKYMESPKSLHICLEFGTGSQQSSSLLNDLFRPQALQLPILHDFLQHCCDTNTTQSKWLTVSCNVK